MVFVYPMECIVTRHCLMTIAKRAQGGGRDSADSSSDESNNNSGVIAAATAMTTTPDSSTNSTTGLLHDTAIGDILSGCVGGITATESICASRIHFNATLKEPSTDENEDIRNNRGKICRLRKGSDNGAPINGSAFCVVEEGDEEDEDEQEMKSTDRGYLSAAGTKNSGSDQTCRDLEMCTIRTMDVQQTGTGGTGTTVNHLADHRGSESVLYYPAGRDSTRIYTALPWHTRFTVGMRSQILNCVSRRRGLHGRANAVQESAQERCLRVSVTMLLWTSSVLLALIFHDLGVVLAFTGKG
jgi:hypothetical protein